MDTSIKEEIIQQLSQLPVYNISSNGIQHTVRCPYCGDSNNPTHGHFSIRIDSNDPLDPMLYSCFKCPSSGILTAQTLTDLGLVIDSSILSGLSKISQASSRVHKITMIKTEQLEVPVASPSEVALDNLEYINTRLGTNYTVTECAAMDIILDLHQFMRHNKIQTLYMGNPISDALINFITYHYVGFISKNRNTIAFRYNGINADKFDEQPKRWVKCKVNPKNMDTNSFYSPPATIDILYTHPINIHIAEGPMDILSIMQNCRITDNDDYFYAVCGFGYSAILTNIIRMGLNTGLNLHIYADGDKTDGEILYQLNKSKLLDWVEHLYIHRNGTGEKDFGVPVDKIKNTYRKVF